MMKALSLKLPDAIFHRLSNEVKKRGTNRSMIIREAIEYYFEHEEDVMENSFYEIASKLCKRFNGPKDLSSNKNHMKGFGE